MVTELGHQAVMAIPSKNPLSKSQIKSIKEKYQDFLGYDLDSIEFKASPLGTSSFFLKKMLWTKQYDVLFYLTDGSLFMSLADKSILHVQVPLILDKTKWQEKLKLKSWNIICTNSDFTKQVIEPAWPVNVNLAHHPMVQVKQISQGTDLNKKEKIILHVGRFFKQLHSKRQDILVDIFRRLRKKHSRLAKNWKLVLIGSFEDAEYVQEVRDKIKSLPIEIIHDIDRAELIKWYQRASIYWHATGYRVNDQKEPQKVEHFGISTVEAMAAGCVPIVIGKGGQLEVVGPDLEKWTWLTKRDCVKKTAKVLRKPELMEHLQRKAQQEAVRFGPEPFKAKLKMMLET